MNIIPTVLDVPTRHLYGIPLRLSGDLPDFIRITKENGVALSFARPTNVDRRADSVDYTSGSLTLRVYRG